ncbi:MAG: nAD(FAD)-utilizing dehydrogenase [Candidatus Magasanikbacteria bacterium GW2011_GWC2_37_14]|uniref:NAD(FAD)-utilizing dehydrogenase n=1 Tax=Candidatus Magasanikbacteria bacterium GW2011_GWC2_37_14 TaxID=1619046 RepID=A0A0G0JIY4_9BACT|nr:MAG: nAD(FAD)-utilizing dehydrogenase [Candidatus Magasanikbacteria bacterium GW2011_GWC2_37_14]
MRIAIIGGGAAGMMCAATICEENPEVEVFLIEKNSTLGKKVLLTGGGRCNLTTGISDLKLVLKNYPRGEKFLQSAMHNFSPEAVYEWFENHGLSLKCEKDNRVFPQSNNSQDVVKVFTNIFTKHQTNLILNSEVKKVVKKAGEFKITFRSGKELLVDKVVLTTGGFAYHQTGSTGDGYTLAESLGHSVSPLAPSLSSFVTQEPWSHTLAGLSFSEAILKVSNLKTQTVSGPFIFTHKGLSGPAVFALSSLLAFQDCNQKSPIKITLDLFPNEKLEILIKKIKEIMMKNPKKSFKNNLTNLIPSSLIEVIGKELKLPLEKKSAEISKEQIQVVVNFVKGFLLTIVGKTTGEEFVTAGGVELSEVNQRTMESKIVPGLYFAGEILNIDGFTGGFNLQAAWTTGRSAGFGVLL